MADEQRTRDVAPPKSVKADRQERDSTRRGERRRSRSRSPRRDRREERPRKKDSGFKWKEKRKDEDDRRDDRDTRLQRGYRDQYRPRSRSPRQIEAVEDPKSPPPESSEIKEKKKEKKEKKAAPARPSEPMIVVYVNDRLGTKKAIPCFASDPIKDFKVIVASMIGRQPHEILLKRQGERPFKDQLTLQDYGVSNNVQLDLEVNTGD